MTPPPAERIDLADLGLVPGVADAEPAFRAALERLPAQGGVLSVPPGVWRFTRMTDVAVPVVGRSRITIEGNGATLIFNGTTRPFMFRDCISPRIRGFTIDWARPPFSQGEVIGVSLDRKEVDVRIDADFPITGEEPVPALQTVEPGTRWIAEHSIDVGEVVERTTYLAHQTLRLYLSRPLPFVSGQWVILRHAIDPAPLLNFAQCQRLEVEDTVLQCGPGMGVVADNCDGAVVRRLTVAPPQGSRRLMSLTCDGAHFGDCAGDVVVEDSVISATGDDCINIHNGIYRVLAVLDRQTLRIAQPGPRPIGVGRKSAAGDQVDILESDYTELGKVAIARVDRDGDALLLSTDSEIPPGLKPGDMVYDTEASTRSTVRNCRFPGNRARAILVHANATIEKCQFEGQSSSAITMSIEPHFHEGPLIGNVTITENHFTNVGRIAGDPAILIEALVQGAKSVAHDPSRVNRNITIAGNSFAKLRGPAVRASSVEALRLEGNKFLDLRGSAVELNNARDVHIEHNLADPPVLVATDGAEQVVFQNNGGLKLN